MEVKVLAKLTHGMEVKTMLRALFRWATSASTAVSRPPSGPSWCASSRRTRPYVWRCWAYRRLDRCLLVHLALHPLFVYVCLSSISLYLYLPVCLSFSFISLSLSVCMYVNVCIHGSLSLCLSVDLLYHCSSVSLSVSCLSVFFSLNFFQICPSLLLCFSVFLAISYIVQYLFLAICLSVCLSAQPTPSLIHTSSDWCLDLCFWFCSPALTNFLPPPPGPDPQGGEPAQRSG